MKKRDSSGFADTNGLGQNIVDSDNMLSTGLHVHSEEDIFFHIRKPESVHWSIAWSDLMMTMFVLFLVMYIYQSANIDIVLGENGIKADSNNQDQGLLINDENEEANSNDIKGEMPLDDIYDLGRKTFRAETIKDMVKMELLSDKAVRIILPSDLLFDTGEAELKSRAIISLSKIAEVINRTPYMINVVGHTDNVPIHTKQFATNWELSTTRACIVARFLIDKKGLSEKRFYISGHAQNQPLVPNNSQRNRAANRRVEIIITKEMPPNRPGSPTVIY